jgi:hypothetical protein
VYNDEAEGLGMVRHETSALKGPFTSLQATDANGPYRAEMMSVVPPSPSGWADRIGLSGRRHRCGPGPSGWADRIGLSGRRHRCGPGPSGRKHTAKNVSCRQPQRDNVFQSWRNMSKQEGASGASDGPGDCIDDRITGAITGPARPIAEKVLVWTGLTTSLKDVGGGGNVAGRLQEGERLWTHAT